MQRRPLNFQSFDDAIQDVKLLSQSGYERAGQWNLAQICEHNTVGLVGSIKGYPFKLPLPLRLVIRLIAKKKFFKTRSVKAGLKAPPALAPSENLDEKEEIQKLIEAIELFKKHQGDYQTHPVFGNLTRSEYFDFHCIHLAHHLSFLIPKQKA